MADRTGERADACDDLDYVIEDLYGVANHCEKSQDREAAKKAASLATAVAEFRRWLAARRR